MNWITTTLCVIAALIVFISIISYASIKKVAKITEERRKIVEKYGKDEDFIRQWAQQQLRHESFSGRKAD